MKIKPYLMASILIFSSYFLIGCTAQMTQSRGPLDSEYAPKNQDKRRGGVITYSTSGAQFVVKSRRKNAFKKMHKYCEGDYIILEEYAGIAGSSTVINTGPVLGATHFDHPVWNINFECMDNPNETHQ